MVEKEKSILDRETVLYNIASNVQSPPKFENLLNSIVDDEGDIYISEEIEEIHSRVFPRV
jgi:hypothetical protein